MIKKCPVRTRAQDIINTTVADIIAQEKTPVRRLKTAIFLGVELPVQSRDVCPVTRTWLQHAQLDDLCPHQ